MPELIRGVGPNPKQLHFLIRLPEYGIERLAHVTTCHFKPSPEHDHSVMQAMWVLDGELHLEAGGTSYMIRPGMVIVLPAQFRHRPLPSREHPSVEMIDLRIFPPLSNYLSLKMRDFTARFAKVSLQALVQRLGALCAKQHAPDPAAVLSETWNLLQLVRSRSMKEPPRVSTQGQPVDSRIHAAEAIMRLYLEKPLSIRDLSAQVNVSATHLTRLFLAIRKAGPGTVFRRMRMERARELLTGSCLSVKEIGAQCGFAGFNQFVRAFGREFGISPGAFRKTGRTNLCVR